jgi:glycosyltransferase involved in cell wall biosynthesis
VITDSQASKADIVRFLRVPPQKVHVVSEGVAQAFRPTSAHKVERIRGRYRLPHEYILFVGSVEKRKNLVGLLHAYAKLTASGRHSPLVVAGSANRRYPELSKVLQELDLEQDAIFAGYMPERDLPALYSGATLFVFPSLYEGFGLPPLEAMACGTPVVCSNAASLPEVVGDAALMTDPTDVEGLAAAMFRVLTQPDLAADLRQRGLARAAQFTWERTAHDTLAVYEKVLRA